MFSNHSWWSRTYRGTLPGSGHMEGYFQGQRIEGSHHILFLNDARILIFFISDNSAIYFVWGVGFEPVTTRVDTNPLSGRWKICCSDLTRTSYTHLPPQPKAHQYLLKKWILSFHKSFKKFIRCYSIAINKVKRIIF